jgi:hypothetical protein
MQRLALFVCFLIDLSCVPPPKSLINPPPPPDLRGLGSMRGIRGSVPFNNGYEALGSVF